MRSTGNGHLAQIEQLTPDLVVLSSSSKDVEAWVDGEPSGENMDQVWADGLASVIQRVTPVADRVVVLGDMAYPAEPGIDCLSANPDNVGACNTPRDEAVPVEMNLVEQQTAEANGAEFVDTIPWFCTDTTCPAVIGGLTTHRDNFHTAENYAVWLSNVLGQELGMIPRGKELTAIQIPEAN